jgi:RIO-like serine/threonine protein kinase
VPEDSKKTTADALADTELVEPGGPQRTVPLEATETETGLHAAPALDAGAGLASIGRFRIDAPLGSGGMADVHRAYDPLLERPVALKVVRTNRRRDDPQRMRRVLREARAAAALTHPNTVTIFEVGEADGEVFIAMELLSGEVLREILGRAGVALDLKLRWLLQAARALQAAHERGLVHRDVKPDNMFVCSDGTLKLLDFGIAKRDEDDSQETQADRDVAPSSLRTADGRRVGTPRYMAPEQHAGQATDPRTDEYAWGLVAFELLTGLHPGVSQATSPIGTPRPDSSLEANRVATLLARVPELPGPLASAIARALETRKDEMAPIVAVLEAAVDGQRDRATAASAAPDRAGPRPRKWSFVAVLAVVIGGGVTAGVIAIAARRANREQPAAVGHVGPACQITPRPSITLAAEDRVGVLPDGDVITARSIKQGLAVSRETAAGPVPFVDTPLARMFLAAVGHSYRDIRLFGINLAGAPWVVVEIVQEDTQGLLLCGYSQNRSFSRRVFPPVTGLALDAVGSRLVVGVTTRKVDVRPGGRASGAELYLSGGMTPEEVEVEAGGARAPAVAGAGNRIAFSYLFERGTGFELHLAMLDENGRRLGDIHTLKAPAKQPLPAVAFAGLATLVFWIDDSGSKTRLVSSAYTLGDPHPAEVKVASDDATTLDRPVTARLPTGEWIVAWFALAGSSSPTLRVSSIGPSGRLLGPTDVALVSGRYEGLTASSGERGVELAWREVDPGGRRIARFAHVTCDLF